MLTTRPPKPSTFLLQTWTNLFYIFLSVKKKPWVSRALTVVPKTKGIPACALSETAESHDNIDTVWNFATCSIGLLKRDGTRAENRFRLSPKRTSPFKSAGASVQSITGSRGLRISVSNAGYTTFRGSVKSTGYQLHSPVSPSLPLPTSPCVIRFQTHPTNVLFSYHVILTFTYFLFLHKDGRGT